MICQNCGKYVEEGGSFCWNCGTKLGSLSAANAPLPNPLPKNRGGAIDPSSPIRPTANKKHHTGRNVALTVVAILVALIVIGGASSALLSGTTMLTSSGSSSLTQAKQISSSVSKDSSSSTISLSSTSLLTSTTTSSLSSISSSSSSISSGDVQIISQTAPFVLRRQTVIIGIVKNIGIQTVSDVELSATFYFKNGTIADNTVSWGDESVIAPASYSTFELFSSRAPLNYWNYTVAIIDYGINYVCPCSYTSFQISRNSSYYDVYGYYHVVGQVTNVGSSGSNFTEIDGAFYNSSGALVGAGLTFVGTSLYGNLGAGQSVPFNLEVDGLGLGAFEPYQNITSYTLWVGGEVGTFY